MKNLTRGLLIAGSAVLFSACGTPDVGEDCSDGEGTLVCRSDLSVVVCTEGQWAFSHDTDENGCNCINGTDVCAVAGFVGIAEAGRDREAGISLRAALS